MRRALVAPQCADGQDNDEDEEIDFPLESNCQAQATTMKEALGVLNAIIALMTTMMVSLTSLWTLDAAVLATTVRVTTSSNPIADLQDNDRDGLVDFPFDLDVFRPVTSPRTTPMSRRHAQWNR